MVKEVCFSARTSQIPYVKTIVAALEKRGIDCFYQNDISLIGANWQAQWFKGAKEATKIVCVLDTSYPLSEPCCDEFGIARNSKKLVVIYKEPLSSISEVELNDYNGAVLMYVSNQNQGLPPDNIEFIAQEIYKAVRGSAPPPPSSSSVNAQLSSMNIADNKRKEEEEEKARKAAAAAAAAAAKQKYGDQPLRKASEAGDLSSVQALLDSGYKELEEKDSIGYTPLIDASSNGHEAVVRLLIDKGANMEAKDNGGDTPLILASIKGHEAVVRLLIDKGANMEAKNNYGYTPLIRASAKGHEAVVRLLIDKGANMEAKDPNGWTPLIFASANGYEAMVRLLIDKGANMEAKTNEGKTALMWAKEKGKTGVVAILGR